jgi:hypothetical protein
MLEALMILMKGLVQLDEQIKSLNTMETRILKRKGRKIQNSEVGHPKNPLVYSSDCIAKIPK